MRISDWSSDVCSSDLRLMFIDDRLCVFSQLLWSAGEGLDNPQLVLRRNEDSAGSSLYKGYRDYFEALWELDTTAPVTADTIADLPACSHRTFSGARPSRSAERRVGKEGVRRCRSRGWQYI